MLFTCGAAAGGLVLSFGEASGGPPAEVWSFGRHVTLTLLTVYALRMAAEFTISATTIAARLGLAPRWLVVFGMATGLSLLVTAAAGPWIEIVFPLWVFVFSAYILFATFSSPPSVDS